MCSPRASSILAVGMAQLSVRVSVAIGDGLVMARVMTVVLCSDNCPGDLSVAITVQEILPLAMAMFCPVDPVGTWVHVIT